MTIAAIYRNGVFEPLERVELEENKRVEIEVRESEAAASAPAAKSLWELGGKKLLGMPGPDFKELGREWKEYVE